jgi:hypothetical protein
MSDKPLMLEDFKDHVGSVFTITYPDIAPISLTLDEAAPLQKFSENPKQRNPFSLIFVGPSDVVLVQRIHLLKHEEMGELPIFLVTVGKDERGYHYQAVFN